MKVPIKNTDKIKVSGSYDVYPIMQRVLKRENKISKQQEHFWVIGMDKGGVILYIELLGLGNMYATPVDTQAILRMAIYKMAVSIILVHNHPSGNLKPSEADITITEFIKHGGYFTNITLVDHLIINEKSYFSFKDNKLFKPNPKK